MLSLPLFTFSSHMIVSSYYCECLVNNSILGWLLMLELLVLFSDALLVMFPTRYLKVIFYFINWVQTSHFPECFHTVCDYVFLVAPHTYDVPDSVTSTVSYLFVNNFKIALRRLIPLTLLGLFSLYF